MDFIQIDALRLECIIGIHPHERQTPQTLIVAATLNVELEKPALSGNINDTIDYDALSTQMAFILREGRFRLLETAALALCYLILEHAQALATQDQPQARVHITKPAALGGLAIPSVCVSRQGPPPFDADSQHPEARLIFACSDCRIVRTAAGDLRIISAHS